jgi:hypothetical protein
MRQDFLDGEGSEQLIATITPPNTIGTLKFIV